MLVEVTFVYLRGSSLWLLLPTQRKLSVTWLVTVPDLSYIIWLGNTPSLRIMTTCCLGVVNFWGYVRAYKCADPPYVQSKSGVRQNGSRLPFAKHSFTCIRYCLLGYSQAARSVFTESHISIKNLICSFSDFRQVWPNIHKRIKRQQSVVTSGVLRTNYLGYTVYVKDCLWYVNQTPGVQRASVLAFRAINGPLPMRR